MQKPILAATGDDSLPTTLVPLRAPTVIRAESSWALPDVGELWRYRELLWILTGRDLKVRYRHSLLGILWTVMQPVLTVAIFVTLFALLGTVPTSGHVPYTVALLCGVLPWNFFVGVLNQAANSLQVNSALINKIYCPRLIFPLSSVLTGMVDLGAGVLVLLAVTMYLGIIPTAAILLLPVFVLMAAAVGLGTGLWIAATSVRLRDFRFMLPAVLQVWFFASPVVYDVRSLIPVDLLPLYNLNPMAGILEGIRWSLVGGDSFDWSMLSVSGPASLVWFLGGLSSFRRVERTVADHL